MFRERVLPGGGGVTKTRKRLADLWGEFARAYCGTVFAVPENHPMRVPLLVCQAYFDAEIVPRDEIKALAGDYAVRRDRAVHRDDWMYYNGAADALRGAAELLGGERGTG